MADAPRNGTELMHQFVPASPFASLLGLDGVLVAKALVTYKLG